MPSLKIVKSGETKPFLASSVILYGVVGVGIALVLMLVASAIFLYTDTDIDYVSIAARSILFVSAFVSGMLCSKRKNERGYLYGACTGLTYSLLLLLISLFLGTTRSLSFLTFLTVFLCVISGALGGILGINLKNNKKRRRNV